jgi:hypothetical protein
MRRPAGVSALPELAWLAASSRDHEHLRVVPLASVGIILEGDAGAVGRPSRRPAARKDPLQLAAPVEDGDVLVTEDCEAPSVW